MSEYATPDRIRFVEADAIPPGDEGGDEIWWMNHFWCDCGWQSHDSHDDLPDDGLALAQQHAAETGHQFSDDPGDGARHAIVTQPQTPDRAAKHTIHCWDCGHMQIGSGSLPERCPGCGHPLRFPKDGYSTLKATRS